MKNKNMSENKISVINIFGCILVVFVNTLINFFLSPFIVENLGVEANGYITLANNFISYFSLITVALNSMSGRFILIELRKKNLHSANEYYSSVFWGNLVLSFFMIVLCIILLFNLENFINIDLRLLSDTKKLFAITFSSFFVGLVVPKWSNATYITNRLYLRSIQNIFATIVRAACIYVLFLIFKPSMYFVAIAGLVMTLTNTIFEYAFKRRLIPELRVRLKDFDYKKVKELVASGIWNTITKCGNLLLEGLDILIANLFIDSTASGILSLSKIIPNMMIQIVGNIATTFGPKLTYLYADNKIESIQYEVKKNIKLLSLLATIPTGIILVFGECFFELWVPSQNARVLSVLSSLTLLGVLVSGVSQCISNVFGVVNKLKFNSCVIIIFGLLNIIVVYMMLKFTSLGVFAIAGVSSGMAIIREFVFTATYAAKCIKAKWYVFHKELLVSLFYVIIPIGVSVLIKLLIPLKGWGYFGLAIILSVVIIILIEGLLLLNKEERQAVFAMLRVK